MTVSSTTLSTRRTTSSRAMPSLKSLPKSAWYSSTPGGAMRMSAASRRTSSRSITTLSNSPDRLCSFWLSTPKSWCWRALVTPSSSCQKVRTSSPTCSLMERYMSASRFCISTSVCLLCSWLAWLGRRARCTARHTPIQRGERWWLVRVSLSTASTWRKRRSLSMLSRARISSVTSCSTWSVQSLTSSKRSLACTICAAMSASLVDSSSTPRCSAASQAATVFITCVRWRPISSMVPMSCRRPAWLYRKDSSRSST
mmetsp:Transcript_3849/g.9726  ORF Transcript_3849/g.9726 Transcript_3849/m.9726 type:complete len:256 (+) Transcript_3849:1387-2154(+)